MDAVGRLAGGVAHDFNNLLTVISAHSSFLLEALGAGDALREDAEAIHKAGIRAAGLTRQLLAFSRKQILKPTVLDLGAIVAETEKMLERLLGEDIEIVTDCAPELYPVVTDATQIEQVIVNLAVNARDAMPDGGTLTIATRNATVETSGQEERRSMPPGEYVLLEVTDTGVGMDDSVKARMFEPFFTTKQPGQGTGLGLATVYGIVKQSAGYVFVESALGQGTTFQVYLPAAINGGASDELRAAESVAVRGVETVLLIEDESAVRQIAHRILKRQGYQVLLAASGAEALDASRAYRATIHLVISDAVMPGMSGAEVVKRLQEERPGLKVLFMSGYTDDEILRRGIVSSTTAFIQKPFTLAAFSLAAREALDG
jgi:CheY-like chemotaxis protein